MSTPARLAGAFCVVSFLIASRATAQGGRAHVGLAASLTFPKGDFRADANGDGFNMGWQGTALIDLDSPRSALGLRLKASYGENRANDKLKADLTADVGQPTDAKYKMLGGGVDLKVHLKSSGRQGGYLIGGIGSYRVTLAATSGNTTVDSSETKFAWNVGMGFTGNPRGRGWLVELHYHSVAGLADLPRTNFFALTAGVRFGGP